MKNKILSALLVISLVGVVVLAYVNSVSMQSPEEKKADLVALLSHGEYDYDYNLVPTVGTDPGSLADRARAVVMIVLDDKGSPFFAQSTLALILDNEVIVPYEIFYLPMPDGDRLPAWVFSDVSLEFVLLPDSNREDAWKKEKLGRILNLEDLASGTVSLAVIERVDPIITTGPDYVLGEYSNLSVGHALYVISQANGRMNIGTGIVSEVYDNDGQQLFSDQRQLLFNELGGIAFALRDGKPELVGFLSAMEPASDLKGTAYIYYQDIRQILDYVKMIRRK